jgi:cellobiose phosphorylase
VYTHAATWVVIAEAMLGRAAAANRLYAKILPINRGTRPDAYVAEPYVTPGNIEGPASPHEGRGGWTWYTGSAAWLFKVGLEWILGVRPTIAGLVIDPSILPAWKGYEVTRQFRGVTLRIAVRNPRRVSSGVAAVQIDGVAVEPVPAGRGVLLPAFAPGETHDVHITLGPPR